MARATKLPKVPSPASERSFEAVRKAALAMTGVEEGTAYGFPAFRAGRKMFAGFRKDLDSVLFHATFEQRDAMIAEEPDIYHTTDHHRPYPWVLARASTLPLKAIPDLLQMALRTAPEPQTPPRKKRK